MDEFFLIENTEVYTLFFKEIKKNIYIFFRNSIGTREIKIIFLLIIFNRRTGIFNFPEINPGINMCMGKREKPSIYSIYQKQFVMIN